MVAEGKGGYQRYFPISPRLRDELLGLLPHRSGDFIFHDSKGKPFKDIKKSFNAAMVKAKLEDVHFQDLRRTFATQHAFGNAEMKIIQGWLGHKSIETTGKHYIGASGEREQQERNG
jgi:integrase